MHWSTGSWLVVSHCDDLLVCSAKLQRLDVRPEFRGHDIGKRLANIVISEAKSIGYTEMLLDTLPTMTVAQKLYSSLGFQECSPYRHNPIEGTKYMKLVLKGEG